MPLWTIFQPLNFLQPFKFPLTGPAQVSVPGGNGSFIAKSFSLALILAVDVINIRIYLNRDNIGIQTPMYL